MYCDEQEGLGCRQPFGNQHRSTESVLNMRLGQIHYLPLISDDLFHLKSQGLRIELFDGNGDAQMFGFYSDEVSRLVHKERNAHHGHAMLNGFHHTVHPSVGDKQADAGVS